MPTNLESFRNVRFVSTDDPEYVAFQKRMADKNPGRGGPRAAGEYLGGLVEQCVRHWIGLHVPLKPERILTWEQRLNSGRHGTLFREVDAVWRIDPESFCLYEVKLTTLENMARGNGIKQLNASAETLYTDRAIQYVLKRLVYVSEEPVEVLDGLPALAVDDEHEELGVVWVSPQMVEAQALACSIELPPDWLLPESREGAMEDPERDEWRRFAGAEEQQDETGGRLASALKRALDQNQK